MLRAFEWDQAKDAANRAAHGLSFETATAIFADPMVIEVDATRAAERETRTKAIGRIEGRLYTSSSRAERERPGSSPRDAATGQRSARMAIVRSILDPANPPRMTADERARIEALTPEDIERNALGDPDNPPMTDEDLARGAAGRFVRLTRQGLGLTQQAFADRYNIGLPRLRDWEQGRYLPDSVAMAYLAVIAQAPDVVQRALASAEGLEPRA